MKQSYSHTSLTLTYICSAIIIGFFYFLGGILSILEFIFTLIIYFLFWYMVVFLWKKIRKKEIPDLYNIGYRFIKNIGFFLVVLGTMVGSWSYYQNSISPAIMPAYTLSNGEKTVLFQTMSHIGSESFYQNVVSNLTQAKQDNFVYFFEGVRPGSPENTKRFNEIIGIEFDATLYENFSKLYGVTHQDNSIFLGLENDKDYNIDLSLDDIVELYDARVGETQKNYEVPVDISAEIITLLTQLSENELKVLRYINQSLLNFFIKNDSIQQVLSDNFTNGDIFAIILDERNDLLANSIIESEYDKIYTTYGLLHFKGVLELLQKSDPNWKIIEKKELYPISIPRNSNK
ncbi:hypothetical protein MK079_00500 [Candidatus Gracilibacteria bacterium]|nr:hypothetical protein [Candidatus Gracilibacteria bacterium]